MPFKWTIGKASAERSIPAQIERKLFSNTPFTKSHASNNQPHAKLSALRNSMQQWIQNLIQPSSFSLFMFDKKFSSKHADGTVTWRDVSDTKLYQETGALKQNSAIMMINSDHNYDMNYLINHTDINNIFYLYTLQPRAVAKSGQDLSYTFESDGQLTSLVSGRAPKTRYVYNYQEAEVKSVLKWWNIPISTTYCSIHRRDVGVDHAVIMIIPRKRWTWLRAIAANILGGEPLKHLIPLDQGYLRMFIRTNDNLLVSTGKPGSYKSATIPATVDTDIAIVAENSTTALNLHTTKSYLDDPELATVLWDYHKNTVPGKPPIVLPVDYAIRTFQNTKYQEYDPDAKCGLDSFMPPIIDGAYCHCNTMSNTLYCAEKRVIEPAIKLPAKFDGKYYKYAAEWVKLSVTDIIQKYKLRINPVSFDEVWKQQNSAQQHVILEDGAKQGQFHREAIKGFEKVEAGTSVRAPRPITPQDIVAKLVCSALGLAVKELHHYHKWYAFGKDRRQIDTEIADMLSQPDVTCADLSDFVMFDAHRNALSHYKDMIRMRAIYGIVTQFTHDHVQHLSELTSISPDKLEEQVNEYISSWKSLTIYASHGVKYQTDYQEGSGGAGTSDKNSDTNAFIKYCCYREAKQPEHESYFSVDSKNKIGGDDGVAANKVPNLCKVAHEMGYEIEQEIILRGQPGVNFFSRYFKDPWNGSPVTCCNPKRTWTKFHCSANMGTVSNETKFLAKCIAYNFTDHSSLVIGPLTTKALQLATTDERNRAEKLIDNDHFKSALSYLYTTNRECQPANDNDLNWQEVIADMHFPGVMNNYPNFLNHVNRSTTLTQLMQVPTIYHILPIKRKDQEPAVVDGLSEEKQNVVKPTHTYKPGTVLSTQRHEGKKIQKKGNRSSKKRWKGKGKVLPKSEQH
jgi:hypothetical protein